MSVPELGFRLRRFVQQRKEQRRVESGWRPVPSRSVEPGCCLFGDDAHCIAEWKRHFELDYNRLDEYLAGRINYFGHQPLDSGMPVSWHRDPVTGTRSPLCFGKSLNYRNDEIVGNVKFIWELGRHQHLVPLAVAYAVTGEARFRESVAAQIDSWIEGNPFGMGIHWCTSLEVSLRLVSWAIVHSLLVLRDGKEGLFAAVDDRLRLGEVIFQQAYFVRHYLSRYSSANNHLIGELTGLWVACQVFDLGEEGREWSAFSLKMLEDEVVRQVHSDGVDKEQAFYYHLWVLEYYFFVWLVGVRCGHEISAETSRRIVLMTRFLKDVSVDAGEPPQFGDADDGFVARFDPLWPDKPYEELIAAIAGVLGDHNESNRYQKAFWYQAMVPASQVEFPELGWQREYPVIYPEGGYAILGSENCHLVFDAGPLGYPEIAAHGHADALSFCLAVDGAWWIVDPGTYAYHSDPEWRSYFRGTAAHNTIRLNGEDQSRIAGSFMWSEKADAWIDSSDNNNKYQEVTGLHDGYRHLGVIHRRRLRLWEAEQCIEILDRLEGIGRRAELAEIYYHFAPDVDIRPGSENSQWLITRKGRSTRLILHADPSWNFEVARGSVKPISGWYSPALEEKVPTTTLRGAVAWSPSTTCLTRITIA